MENYPYLLKTMNGGNTYGYLDKWPYMLFEYETPSPKVYMNRELVALLSRKQTPRVIVRVVGAGSEIAEQERTRPYYNYIEEQLTRIGCKVMDRNLISQVESKNGYVDYQSIKNRIQVDLIIEVSWLRFSDRDMWTPLKTFRVDSVVAYDQNLTEYRSNSSAYKTFEDVGKWKNWSKLCKKGIAKSFTYLLPGEYCHYDINSDYRFKEMKMYKNTVSMLCKIINVADGSIGGTIHVGIPLTPTIYDLPEAKGNFRHYSKNTSIVESYSRYDGSPYYKKVHLFEGYRNGELVISRKSMEHGVDLGRTQLVPEFIAQNIIPAVAENPFAAQLNAGEDVKISGEKTITESNSNASGNGSTYYGYYSSYSRGNNASNSSTTTTQVDAQYIRCSDFYDCYRPLAEQLADELKKYMKR